MEKEFEALDWLNDTLGYFLNKTTDTHCQITLTRNQATEFVEEHKKVEQALTNKQDLEKFTKLIIDKRVDMNLLAIRHNVESYNNDYYDSHYSYDVGAYLLFEKEFTFIKKVIAIYGQSI